MAAPTDDMSGAERWSRRRRLWFALGFAIVPNAIAFLIWVDGLVGPRQSGLVCPLGVAAYCLSVPGVVVNLPLYGESMAGLVTGVVVNVLVDAWIAYRLTALRSRWLGLLILTAYVVISRYMAFAFIEAAIEGNL